MTEILLIQNIPVKKGYHSDRETHFQNMQTNKFFIVTVESCDKNLLWASFITTEDTSKKNIKISLRF